MRAVHLRALSAVCCAVLLARGSARARTESSSTDGWPVYGHDAGGMRYSPLTQITRSNVARLKIAWVFHTGDLEAGAMGTPRSGFESTPLVVDGALYLTTPFNRIITVDPEAGAQ